MLLCWKEPQGRYGAPALTVQSPRVQMPPGSEQTGQANSRGWTPRKNTEKRQGNPGGPEPPRLFTNTSWSLRSCRVRGGNAALCVHCHFPGAPLALQTIRRTSCSLERTFSTSPANLLSKDTSCFPLVYTGKAVPGTRTLGRLVCHGFFKNLVQNILSLPRDKGK